MTALHHSSETSLIHLLDSIYHVADNGLATVRLLSLDLSAACDTINHTILYSIVSLPASASWFLSQLA